MSKRNFLLPGIDGCTAEVPHQWAWSKAPRRTHAPILVARWSSLSLRQSAPLWWEWVALHPQTFLPELHSSLPHTGSEDPPAGSQMAQSSSQSSSAVEVCDGGACHHCAPWPVRPDDAPAGGEQREDGSAPLQGYVGDPLLPWECPTHITWSSGSPNTGTWHSHLQCHTQRVHKIKTKKERIM